MSNTAAVHERFWGAMAERFGKRWYDTYGPSATHAWRELLDRYSPRQIHAALDLMRTRAYEHPPTEPQFAELLVRASINKPTDDPAELRRGYWRSAIVHQVAQGLGYDIVTLEPVLISHRESLGRACRDLLDDLDTLESRTGQRTEGQLTTCAERCRDIVRAFGHVRAAA
jgi:hypothetical protein